MNWIILRPLLYLLSFTYILIKPGIEVVLPINKQVVHVKSLDVKVDSRNQYPIVNFIGLVEQHGYTAEEYNVTTDDGYILRLHRISGSPTHPKRDGKKVIYLQHGIGLSSDSWVLIGPLDDLAFLLADDDYDVWIGNVRGNSYSRAHLTKNPNNPDFWEFSYHEMGIYDAKSFIDHILTETGVETLTFYGYSMGTTISYVFLSAYPEYNAKIDLLYSAAPAVYWKHDLERLVKIIEIFFGPIQTALETWNLYELLPQSALAAFIGDKFCGDDDILTQPVCVLLFSNIGLDPLRFNKTALPNILAHFPAGISKQTVYHYYQNYKKQSFQAYDYGTPKNIKKYGRPIPPYYNLTKITVPTAIYYALADDIINEKDVKLLALSLPNVISVEPLNNPRFNHFDFLWAKDVRQLLYDKLV